MGWLTVFQKSKHRPAKSLREIVDITDEANNQVLDLTMSIHELPPEEDRFGAALCMVSRSSPPETTGSVVPIGRRPHIITKGQFQQLIQLAGQCGHLSDGFLEIEAIVDLNAGTVVWQPEDGAGVTLPYLEEVVENAVASLVETNLFGQWFTPTAVSRMPIDESSIK